MNNIIIYGDTHGCLEEFKELRAKINPKANDKEILVGDILDRGPYSNELLKYVRENNIASILGNHEYKYLRYKNHQNITKSTGKKNPIVLNEEQKYIYNNLTQEDFKYLESLQFFIKIDNLTIIHAGITNNINLETASQKELEKTLWIRTLDQNQKVVSLFDTDIQTQLWSEYYDGDQGFIVYGHQVFDEIKVDKYSIGIDTGCVYGKKLTAIIIKDTKKPFVEYEIISIDAKKTYSQNSYIA
jgi:bis(5'-nucleosyl)-tetraphosphatase (symmetrical)